MNTDKNEAKEQPKVDSQAKKETKPTCGCIPVSGPEHTPPAKKA